MKRHSPNEFIFKLIQKQKNKNVIYTRIEKKNNIKTKKKKFLLTFTQKINETKNQIKHKKQCKQRK